MLCGYVCRLRQNPKEKFQCREGRVVPKGNSKREGRGALR